MRGVFRGVPLLTFLKRTSPYIHRIQLQCYFYSSVYCIGELLLMLVGRAKHFGNRFGNQNLFLSLQNHFKSGSLRTLAIDPTLHVALWGTSSPRFF